MTDFPQLVKNELEKARRKHPGNQRSLHEGYGVILEEVDEFWDLVKQQKPDKGKLLEELVQISAMCQRTAEDLVMSMDSTPEIELKIPVIIPVVGQAITEREKEALETIKANAEEGKTNG